MSDKPIDLITISREYGSGGAELAHALGAYLGWPVLEHELAHRVAERLAIDEETVEEMDERAPSLFARVASALVFATPEMPLPLPPEQLPDADVVAEAAREVMTEAAASPPAIIVGHGSQCLFARRPGTLHLRVVAPFAERVRRVQSRAGCAAGDAGARARHFDEVRAAYVRRHHGCDWRDGALYDLQLNTARLSMAECVTVVAALVGARAPGNDADVVAR